MLLTVGRFNQNASTIKNATIPTAPTTNGARTCAEVHGKRIPAQVMAIRNDTELPTISVTPLQTNVRDDTRRFWILGLRQVHLPDLLAQGSRRLPYAQENNGQYETKATDGEVEIK